jgi:NTE family protein
MKLFSRKYSTGLALSGGAARGIAHLGVFQALNEKKIEVGIISGSSAGALAGAFFAEGFAPEEILSIISRKKFYELVSFASPRKGFFRVEGLKKILESHLKTQRIENLPIPLVVCVTNFREGRPEYLTEGPLIDSLIASASIPVLFRITTINSTPYIDGGVMDNLPIEPIRDRCRKLIAVHTNPVGRNEDPQNPVQIAERAFHLSVASGIQRKKELADIFIEPPELQDFGFLELKKSKDIFRVGYEAAIKALS